MDYQAQERLPSPVPFVVIPFLPPSANHIYVTDWRRKMRFLTKEADAFKKQTIAYIQQEKLAAIGEIYRRTKEDPNVVFSTYYVFYFPKDDLLNKTYGKGKKDSAASRYKRMDVENRVKLVADALSKALGIDDSLFFEAGHAKRSVDLVGGTPQIHVYFSEADPRRFGL